MAIPRQSSLDPLGSAWARKIFSRVGHIVQPTAEEWELGFVRDNHHTVRLFAWEVIARSWDAYRADNPGADKGLIIGYLSRISPAMRVAGWRPVLKHGTVESEALRIVFDRSVDVFFADCEKLDLMDPNHTAANARLVEYLGLGIDPSDYATQSSKGEARTDVSCFNQVAQILREASD